MICTDLEVFAGQWLNVALLKTLIPIFSRISTITLTEPVQAHVLSIEVAKWNKGAIPEQATLKLELEDLEQTILVDAKPHRICCRRFRLYLLGDADQISARVVTIPTND